MTFIALVYENGINKFYAFRSLKMCIAHANLSLQC